MSVLPVAPVVEVLPPEDRRCSWKVLVACPYCRDKRGRPGRHLHAILGPGDDEFPLLRSRAADCAPGGEYVIGPLPLDFEEQVRAYREKRR